MYSKALTLLEVTLITLSSLTKLVYKEAIATTISNNSLKIFLVFSIYTEPLVIAIFSNVNDSSSRDTKTGNLTPAMLLTVMSRVKLALLT